ncbi:MAG: prepilin-type N-terminal cleavage/methylation domain-containing protein [Oscillibacter sp.]|nr:prepilin-type N-terminal cleavage/methylation domain-containing protein [Oscillibacter sp.]
MMKEKCTALVKARDKKGFTLMEMLIVVAIIAVLIAIAIPTFSSQLKKANIAADQANVRSAYAVMQTCRLLNVDPTSDAAVPTADTTWYMQKDGSFMAGDAGKTNAYALKADGYTVDTVTGFTPTKGNGIAITYTATSGSFALSNLALS